MAIKVGINGYGRIGRNILRALYEAKRTGEISIVAINDLGDANTNAHLTRHDTAHGPFPGKVAVDGNHMVVNGDRIRVLAERDPAKLPWGELGADIVLECTGPLRQQGKGRRSTSPAARRRSSSRRRRTAWTRRSSTASTTRRCAGDMTVISNASCTTNCLAPLVKPLHDGLGVVAGIMTTMHAYTNDQVLTDVYHSGPAPRALGDDVDDPDQDRRGRLGRPRAAGTEGQARRLLGARADDQRLVRRPHLHREARDHGRGGQRHPDARRPRAALKGILEYTEEPLVSVDFNHNPASGTVDAQLTKVLGGTLVKVCAWYDNEWGFSNRMLDTTLAWSRAG